VNEIEHSNCYQDAFWNQRDPPDWKPKPFYSLEDGPQHYIIAVDPIPSNVTAQMRQEAMDRATADLYRKLFKAHHQTQGGVILGELHKTGKLLAGAAAGLKRDVVKYLAKAVGISRGQGTKRQRVRAIANTYLEATYGWQPLIGDCKDIAREIGRLAHEQPRNRLKAVGGAEKQISAASGGYTSGFLAFKYRDILEARVAVYLRGFLQGAANEAANLPAQRLISMSGFDLRSFIPTVWELVPYSFLVDYFTNIGDCLYALSCDTACVGQLWKTEVSTTTYSFFMSPDTAQTCKNIHTGNRSEEFATGTAGRTVIRNHSVSRGVIAMPLLVPRFTGVDLPWRQYVNIGALLLGNSRKATVNFS
jgi:hypothetical protein